ncbi:unnamed protein product, partial [Sphacelaria rigidula]
FWPLFCAGPSRDPETVCPWLSIILAVARCGTWSPGGSRLALLPIISRETSNHGEFQGNNQRTTPCAKVEGCHGNGQGGGEQGVGGGSERVSATVPVSRPACGHDEVYYRGGVQL